MGLNLKKFFFDYELDQMSRYLIMVKKSLNQELEELDDRYKIVLEDELEDSYEDQILAEEYSDKFVELQKDFPKLTYGSFVVGWYSFIEQSLLDICEQSNLQIIVNAKDNGSLGRGIFRARKFLSESAKFEFDSKIWQELININRLRNFIVHEGYKMRGSYLEIEKPFVVHRTNRSTNIYFSLDENLYKYLQKHLMILHTDITLDIVPNYNYCNYLIKFARSLFTPIFSSLESR